MEDQPHTITSITKCIGCLENQGNQMAHMCIGGCVGGCLYTLDSQEYDITMDSIGFNAVPENNTNSDATTTDDSYYQIG